MALHTVVVAATSIAIAGAVTLAQPAPVSVSPIPESTAWLAPAPSPSVALRPRPRTPAVDGAFSLPGVWKCQTFGQMRATTVYDLANPTTIVERSTVELRGGRLRSLEATYRFAPASDTWTVSVENGLFSGTAPSWSGRTWTFDGFFVVLGKIKPLRLVYTSLGDGANRFDYESKQGGVWRTLSGAICGRTL